MYSIGDIHQAFYVCNILFFGKIDLRSLKEVIHMNFIWFLIIGLIAGWAAGKIMQGSSFGIGGNVIVGVVGAFIGGFLLDLIGFTTYGLVGSLVMSIIGAIVLLFIINMVSHGEARVDKTNK